MPLWTPSQIATALWLDGSDASTLFDATDGGSLVAADGTVARWEDKSGNSRHVTQATAANRPLRTLLNVNSVSELTFDGTNDAVALASDLSLGTAHSIFIVARSSATITAASAPSILLSGGTYTNPSTTTSDFLLGIGSVTGNLTNERLWSLVVAHFGYAPQVYGYGKTNADISAPFITSSAYTTTGNAFRGRFNGSADFAAISTAGAYDATNTRYPTLLRSIGNRHFNNSAFWSGGIHEVIVCPSYLSTADTQIVEGYLAWRWGLQSSLPADHTYKSAAPQVAGGGGRLINGTSLVRPAGIADHSPLIIGAT